MLLQQRGVCDVDLAVVVDVAGSRKVFCNSLDYKRSAVIVVVVFLVPVNSVYDPAVSHNIALISLRLMHKGELTR